LVAERAVLRMVFCEKFLF